MLFSKRLGCADVQGVQALTQQVLRLYGVGFAILLGEK